MIFILKILVAWLLADLLTGIFHWFEDQYLDGNCRFKFVNSLARENELHHAKPTAMLTSPAWLNMRDAVVVCWPAALILWLLGAPWIVWLVLFFAGFGNLIHRFAHTPKRQLPRWIRGCQEFGLFISPDHHDDHHRAMDRLVPKKDAWKAYCPMTDWVNPVLDRIRFWGILESLLARVGIKPIKSL